MISPENSQKSQDGVVTTLIKGGLVGIANIIPGVSGGTFALILGIFSRLIDALNSLGIETIKACWRFVKGGFKGKARADFIEELRRIDIVFLILLAIGAVVAIFSSTFLIEILLKDYYSPTLAFFIGLIIPSIAIPWAMMDKRGLALLWIIPGIALTFGVSCAMPDSAAGSDNPLVALLTGAIAISAMILPGLSGSYVMLVMGQYQNVLAKITGFLRGLSEGQIDFGAVIWLGALAIGMGVGILLFARLLHFLLVRFKSATMAFLIGLLLGSLWVLWPFKDISAGAQVTDRKGEVKDEIKIATAPNRMPESSGEGLVVLGAFAVGVVVSGSMVVVGKRKKSDS